MIEIYAAYRNQDDTEGRGPMVLDKMFLEHMDAVTYLRQQTGVMGRKPRTTSLGTFETGWERMGDWEMRKLWLYESLPDMERSVKAQLKTQALSKLTPEEQRALGL